MHCSANGCYPWLAGIDNGHGGHLRPPQLQADPPGVNPGRSNMRFAFAFLRCPESVPVAASCVRYRLIQISKPSTES